MWYLSNILWIAGTSKFKCFYMFWCIVDYWKKHPSHQHIIIKAWQFQSNCEWSKCENKKEPDADQKWRAPLRETLREIHVLMRFVYNYVRCLFISLYSLDQQSQFNWFFLFILKDCSHLSNVILAIINNFAVVFSALWCELLKTNAQLRHLVGNIRNILTFFYTFHFR